MSDVRSDFHNQPELDFDPEKVQSPPTEEEERAREAVQSFEFRQDAFTCALVACGVILLLWIALLCNWPEPNMPKEAYYLYGLKLSLCTVALITIAIATLRFAIQCYGHHQPASATGVDNTSVGIIGKFLEQIGKTIQSSSSQ